MTKSISNQEQIFNTGYPDSTNLSRQQRVPNAFVLPDQTQNQIDDQKMIEEFEAVDNKFLMD